MNDLVAPQLIPQVGSGPLFEFWEWLNRHELRVQECGGCGFVRNPPSEVCPSCQSLKVEWTPIEPKGTIYSWTRVWHPVLPDLADRVPYLVAWISIDHGHHQVRVLGNISGDPMQNVRIGNRVVGEFQDSEAGTVLNWTVEQDRTEDSSHG